MRNYKRKTERGKVSIELLQRAADAVIKDGRKLKTVARDLEICHMTLFRFVKKLKAGVTPTVGYYSRQVFNQDQEKTLADYLLKCSSIYFGLLPEEVRKLAYSCAVKFGMPNIPVSWHRNKEAGSDWFTSFLKRNPSLSIRAPEATSAGRASSFNRHNVHEFFSKLGDVILKYNLLPSRIWNLDETGVTTVLKPKKIVAAKGVKRVGAIVSAERGTLVTVELAANAVGNTVPPMFIFPRLKYKDLFIRDGPTESIGAGNSSGWMTAKEFLIFMDHFIKHTKPTPEDPVLLLLDNHQSHVDIDVVEKAKANSVIMLSFPPHCTHNLQPLDVGVNGPFKTYCAKAQENWLRNNPGKTMSIYEIPGIVKHAWPLAATPNNIMNAFKKAGISPYNPDIFTDEDFAPSFVTDRPMPDTANISLELGNLEPQLQELADVNEPQVHHDMETIPGNEPHPAIIESATNEPQPGPSHIANLPNNVVIQATSSTFSPEAIKPLPKAPPRSCVTTKRRIRQSAILTDTPEKNALAEEKARKVKSNSKIKTKVEKRVKKNKVTGTNKRKKVASKSANGKENVKRKVLQDDDHGSDNEEETMEWYCIICCNLYSNSRPGEQWIECVMCKNWAHLKCLKSEDVHSYVCQN
ncbi:unnamed protein product [Arctia plantaginis]|uniref:DDE-1 domain-containing protein n=1 Tax=Arctia plantaginis TaxID=874455 RepID=A0A8S1AVH6_ARCPL|nr:unnamed protein product [Arctia plantaginis]